MIADLMLFAHPPRPEASHFDFAALVTEIGGEFQAEAAERGITVTTRSADPPTWVWADRVQMSVVLRALIQNALEALDHPGEILVETGSNDLQVEVTVRDDGPGIDARVRQHLFDPFFSGREAGRGLGFGLPKAYRLAELHGGQLTVANSPAVTTFTLVIPIDTRGWLLPAGGLPLPPTREGMSPDSREPAREARAY